MPNNVKFYVYELCWPETGLPFYVGKGHGDRIYQHEAAVRLGKHENSKVARIIEEIWHLGQEVLRYIIYETYNEDEAYQLEISTIAEYRSKGVELANYTGGGGANYTINMGRKMSKQHKQKLLDYWKGRKHTDATKLAMSIASKRAWASGKRQITQEQRQKMTEAAVKSRKGKPLSDETKHKISNVKKGRKVSIDTKRKISESVKNAWKDADKRAKMLGKRGIHANL